MLAKTTIRLVKAEQHPFSEEKGGITLAHNNFILEYSGDLTADSVVQELWINYPDGTSDVYGIERVTGYLEGKKGSFVTEHRGRFEDGMIKKNIRIVPNSGTGELKGISGGSHLESGGAKEFAIDYDYNFQVKKVEESCK